MAAETGSGARAGQWRWTLTSGAVTLVLAVVAFFLPDIDLAPKGGIVGWVLFLAGLVELAFGWRRGLDPLGDAAVGSGLLTAGAGLLFVTNPLAGYLPVTNVVMLWLFLRGGWVLAMAMRVRRLSIAPWLGLSGATMFSLASCYSASSRLRFWSTSCSVQRPSLSPDLP